MPQRANDVFPHALDVLRHFSRHWPEGPSEPRCIAGLNSQPLPRCTGSLPYGGRAGISHLLNGSGICEHDVRQLVNRGHIPHTSLPGGDIEHRQFARRRLAWQKPHDVAAIGLHHGNARDTPLIIIESYHRFLAGVCFHVGNSAGNAPFGGNQRQLQLLELPVRDTDIHAGTLASICGKCAQFILADCQIFQESRTVLHDDSRLDQFMGLVVIEVQAATGQVIPAATQFQRSHGLQGWHG